MANRNMMSLVDKNQNSVPEKYQMTYEEMQRIEFIWKADPFKAISAVFTYGFICGNRATRKGKVKNL